MVLFPSPVPVFLSISLTPPLQPLAEMSDRDWRIFREDFDIRVKGGKAPLPLRFWEEGKLPSSVMEAIRELGYEKPSPIQRQVLLGYVYTGMRRMNTGTTWFGYSIRMCCA